MLGTGLSRAIVKASTTLSTEAWRGDEVVRLRHLAAREAHAGLEHDGPTHEQHSGEEDRERWPVRNRHQQDHAANDCKNESGDPPKTTLLEGRISPPEKEKGPNRRCEPNGKVDSSERFIHLAPPVDALGHRCHLARACSYCARKARTLDLWGGGAGQTAALKEPSQEELGHMRVRSELRLREAVHADGVVEVEVQWSEVELDAEFLGV